MAIAPIVTVGDVLTATDFNALPRGIVTRALKDSDQNGITTVANVSSLSVTWTAVSSRYYRIAVYLPQVQQNTAVGVVSPRLTDAADASILTTFHQFQSGDFFPISMESIETSLSGSITRKVRISTSAGTVDVKCAADKKAVIIVQDLGTA